MKRLATALLALLALTGCSVAHATAEPSPSPTASVAVTATATPTWEKPSVASVPKPPPPAPAPAPPAPPAPAPAAAPPAQSAEQWAINVDRAAGLTPPAVGFQFVPAPLVCGPVYGAYGCTHYLVDNATGRIVQVNSVQILASLAFTARGEFVVKHETGHAVYGIRNECAADNFAVAHGGDPAFRTYAC